MGQWSEMELLLLEGGSWDRATPRLEILEHGQF
jgi:hypothetical protein